MGTSDLEEDLSTYEGVVNQEHAGLTPRGGRLAGREDGAPTSEQKLEAARARHATRFERPANGSDGVLITVRHGKVVVPPS